ncbi:MAG: hypothetical protein EA422_05630 [Gemmatimonadales bacterium]|nr:MAG: hypothetical protein EA422_05630 [Gemmatimonadales bacterium]
MAPTPEEERPVSTRQDPPADPHSDPSVRAVAPVPLPVPVQALLDDTRPTDTGAHLTPLLRALVSGVASASRVVALHPEDEALPALVARCFDSALHELPLPHPIRFHGTPSETHAETPAADPSRIGLTLVPLEWRHGRARPRDAGPVGSIFGIWDTESQNSLRAALLLAGVAVYGGHTGLLLSVGGATHLLRMDPRDGGFQLVRRDLKVPERPNRFAFKTEECRRWSQESLAFGRKHFLDPTLPFATAPDVRRVRCLSAEAYRIVQEGGLYLRPHPAGERNGGGHPLLAEAAPIARILETAGGRACDGTSELLDQPVPGAERASGLVFGSSNLIAAFQESRNRDGEEMAPLFGRRGLFRS